MDAARQKFLGACSDRGQHPPRKNISLTPILVNGGGDAARLAVDRGLGFDFAEAIAVAVVLVDEAECGGAALHVGDRSQALRAVVLVARLRAVAVGDCTQRAVWIPGVGCAALAHCGAAQQAVFGVEG